MGYRGQQHQLDVILFLLKWSNELGPSVGFFWQFMDFPFQIVCLVYAVGQRSVPMHGLLLYRASIWIKRKVKGFLGPIRIQQWSDFQLPKRFCEEILWVGQRVGRRGWDQHWLGIVRRRVHQWCVEGVSAKDQVSLWPHISFVHHLKRPQKYGSVMLL